METKAWTRKINRARYVERNILRWIQKNFDPSAVLAVGYSPSRDIISSILGDVEIKEDRMAHQTQFYAMEFEDGSGQPSGIKITEAKFFVLVDWEYVCYMATESLDWIIKSCKEKKQVSMGYKFLNGNRAKGWLIPRDKILSSPLVTTQKRWFPVIDEIYVRTN